MTDLVFELRLGYVAQLYYNILGIKVPSQLDLLNQWFGELIVKIVDEKSCYDSRNKNFHALYNIDSNTIYTYYRHGHLFIGDNAPVKYICGKLVGTAKGNPEKERRTAENIQMHVARRLCQNVIDRIDFENRVTNNIQILAQEQQEQLHADMLSFVMKAANVYDQKNEYDKENEPFPFSNEVFEGIIEKVVYQLTQENYKGLVNAWMWLLLGSTLRNASSRLLSTFDSSFTPLFLPPTETNSLTDRIQFILNKDKYDQFYLNKENGNRFPNIQWYCDKCDAILNNQEGFNNYLPAWQCRKCGHINNIDESEIYDSKEDYRNRNQ